MSFRWENRLEAAWDIRFAGGGALDVQHPVEIDQDRLQPLEHAANIADHTQP